LFIPPLLSFQQILDPTQPIEPACIVIPDLIRDLGKTQLSKPFLSFPTKVGIQGKLYKAQE